MSESPIYSRPALRPVRYVAEPSQVREISVRGSAELAFWTKRLRAEDLIPLEIGGKAQIMVVAAELKFAGIRFTEVSFSVLLLMPANAPWNDAAFLVHAFNSCRPFAFCERVFFKTPYSHGRCRVSVAAPAFIEVVAGDGASFALAMGAAPAAGSREMSRRTGERWEGPIFLPRTARHAESSFFFGRMKGETQTRPFNTAEDTMKIPANGRDRVFRMVLESGFTPKTWTVRADAVHGKSRTFRRTELPNFHESHKSDRYETTPCTK